MSGSYRSPPAAAPSTAPSLSSPTIHSSPSSPLLSPQLHRPSNSSPHILPDSPAQQDDIDLSNPSSIGAGPGGPGADDTDSLADADPHEVAARAQELLALADDPSNHPITGLVALGLIGTTSTDGGEAFDFSTLQKLTPADIPRRIPIGNSAQSTARKNAEMFLRKCVSDVDETDWMFDTPPVFRGPVGLDNLRKEGRNIAGPDGGWQEDAFNRESYQLDDHQDLFQDDFDLEGGDETTMELGPESMFGDGDQDLMDSGSVTSGLGHYGTPYIRDGEEENAIGAGFGLGGSRTMSTRTTRAIVRGVEEMAMI